MDGMNGKSAKISGPRPLPSTFFSLLQCTNWRFIVWTNEEQGEMEADCSGGQNSPWAVAPRGRKEGRKEGRNSECDNENKILKEEDQYHAGNNRMNEWRREGWTWGETEEQELWEDKQRWRGLHIRSIILDKRVTYCPLCVQVTLNFQYLMLTFHGQDTSQLSIKKLKSPL
jgi:hypothetical protein